jgi:PAS domain S-box-containing protein
LERLTIVKEWSPDLQQTSEIDEHQEVETAFRASEQRLQDILDNSAAVVTVKDLQLRYILVNREYERRFQLQRERICGQTDLDLHPRDVAEIVRTYDRHVIESGIPIQFEIAIPFPDGERHFVVVKFLLRDRSGKPYGVCGVSTDVTELKRAEELQARRAREAALRADIHAAFAVEAGKALNTMLQRSAEAIVRHLDAAFARIWTLNVQENVLENMLGLPLVI